MSSKDQPDNSPFRVPGALGWEKKSADHQKQNQERDKSERLEREIGQTPVSRIADKQAHQRIEISESMKLLAHGHWDSVLSFRTTHLQQVIKLITFFVEGLREQLGFLDQLIVMQ